MSKGLRSPRGGPSPRPPPPPKLLRWSRPSLGPRRWSRSCRPRPSPSSSPASAPVDGADFPKSATHLGIRRRSERSRGDAGSGDSDMELGRMNVHCDRLKWEGNAFSELANGLPQASPGQARNERRPGSAAKQSASPNGAEEARSMREHPNKGGATSVPHRRSPEIWSPAQRAPTGSMVGGVPDQRQP